MCMHCGCSDDATSTVTDLHSGQTVPVASVPPHDHAHAHDHDRDHDHGPTHNHVHHGGTTIRLERALLDKNNRLAERNRAWFAGRDILALNLVSSPGAGKTALLERTLRDLGKEIAIQVVEG